MKTYTESYKDVSAYNKKGKNIKCGISENKAQFQLETKSIFLKE
jgi:hypothetical protein